MILSGMVGRAVEGKPWCGLETASEAKEVQARVAGSSVENGTTIVWGLYIKDEQTQILVGFKAAGLKVIKEPGGL